jgi:DNA-directed RNA polymerase subunit N (RpoN/RPB10)
MNWKESEPSPVIKIEKVWVCGSVRIEKYAHGYRTFHNGEPANIGTTYPTLEEAKRRVTLWAINGIRQELDNLGIKHKIDDTEPVKPSCEHRCYTCGKPMAECAEERWAAGK